MTRVQLMQAPLVDRERELEEFERPRAASTDLRTYGTFPYWNGLVRLVFVVATFLLDSGSDATFFGLLALGDVPLALGAIFGLPRALGRTLWQLLTNRRPA
jgi:hypothetical protein